MYKELLERNSKAFKAMMEIGMKESQEGCAPLKETDKLTLGRFMEFIHTGDYNPANPVPASPVLEPTMNDKTEDDGQIHNGGIEAEAAHEPEPAADVFEVDDSPAPEPVENYWSTWNGSSKKKKKKYISSEKLPSVTAPVETTSQLPTSSKSMANDDWTLDYLPLLLSHAQLWVFADKYGMEALQSLSARRLEEALDNFKYSTKSPTKVADLVQYIYDHTADDDREKVNILRTIITKFAAQNIEALRSSASFKALLWNGGPFVPYLVGKICDGIAIG